MDENNVNFECEPVQDAGNQQQTPPVQNQPPYQPYQQPPYQSYQQPYSPYPQQQEKPKKKDRTTAKLVALIVVVALVASIGGSALTAAIAAITGREDETPAVQEPVVSQVPEETTVELEKHALPEKLMSNDTGKSLTTVQVYEMTINSVVGITTETTTNAFGQEAVAASSGSGFILSEDGYIITNAHVIADATSIEVNLFNGESFKAELVGADAGYDIAVLKIDCLGMPAVSVGDSDKLKVGEEVVAIGNPLGELTFTMTNGILSALDREINVDGNPQNLLQTNAAINSGNSGGPLFDMDGNVIGVTNAKLSGSSMSGTTIEGLGFAIPINDVIKVAYDLVEHGYVRGQAYLGVTIQTLDSDTAAYYSLPVGPRVEEVVPGSCAEKAGIQVGDIIIRFNGVDVENNAALLAEMRKVKAGDVVNATVFRVGSEVEVTITLDEKPSQEILDKQVEDFAQSQQPDPEEKYYYEFPEGFPFGG